MKVSLFKKKFALQSTAGNSGCDVLRLKLKLDRVSSVFGPEFLLVRVMLVELEGRIIFQEGILQFDINWRLFFAHLAIFAPLVCI